MKKILTLLVLCAASCSPLPAQNTLAGNLTVQQALKLLGTSTPAQLTANANDYAPAGFATAAVLRIQSDAPRTITGLAGGAAGRMVWLTNVGSQTISLATESAASTAGNRFAFGASGFDLPAGGSLSIWYDTTSSRWRSATNLAAGGGGTTIDQAARDAAAAAQATADSKQAALANATTLAKVTEAAGLPLWDGAAWPGGGSGGTGTVTNVSVVTANGVSGSVANASTTPAITLALGAITPSSVAATGAVTGSNLSGTNTGDQASVTGNAGTATKLATARTINGVSFDGTAAITVPAAAGTLTGSTLASGVTGSSLTSAAGGSFGTAAFTPASAYEVPITLSAPLSRVANTVSIPAATSSTSGYLTSDDWLAFNGKSSFNGAYSALSGIPATFAPAAHALDGASHSVSGLTAGQFLKATSATTFAFAPHGLTYSDVGADAAGAAAAITLSGLGGVPTSRTVNGHALTGNVSVTPSDLSLAIGTNTQAWSAKLDTVAALAAATGWLHNDGAGVLTWSTPSKSDLGLGSVENAALSTWTGSANLSTVGTITSGTWHGTAIADTYIASAAAWNAKVSFPGFGTTGTTAAVGNDSRLSDARTPTAHNQAWSTITTTPTTLSGYGITDAQGSDADLTALAGLSATGLVARTGAGASSTRTITGTANQITVTNGDGVAGNPTLALPQDLATTSTPTFAAQNLSGIQTIDLSPASGTLPAALSSTSLRLAAGDGSTANMEALAFNSTGMNLRGRVMGGTRATPAATEGDRSFFATTAFGFDGTTSTNGGSYSVSSDGAWSSTSKGTFHQWNGTSSGETSPSMWMTLRRGNLGLGLPVGSVPSAKLHVAGGQYITGAITSVAAEAMHVQHDSGVVAFYSADNSVCSGYVQGLKNIGLRLVAENSGSIRFNTSGYERMVISVTGAIQFGAYGAGTLVTDSSGNITASSDGRLKNVTGSFQRGLADVLKLQPKVYHWNKESGMNTDDLNVGFIAQDVLEVIPEAVGQYRTSEVEVDGKKTKKREKAELLTLSDRPLIAALVNAVRELNEKNTALEARVAALENRKDSK